MVPNLACWMLVLGFSSVQGFGWRNNFKFMILEFSGE